MKLDIEKIKKNLEIFSMFMEYQQHFLEWVEKNKNNMDAFYNWHDKWNGSDHTVAEECDCLEEKKELPIIEFLIQYMYLDERFPCMRILNNNNEVFRMVIKENGMECEIKDIQNIEGI